MKTFNIFSLQGGRKKGNIFSNLLSWQTGNLLSEKTDKLPSEKTGNLLSGKKGNLLSGKTDYIFSGASFPLCIPRIEIIISLVLIITEALLRQVIDRLMHR